MTSHEHERVVQERDASTKKRVQSGDSNVLDHGPRDCTMRSSFEPDSIFLEKMTLEDVEEDYLIEIPLLDQGVSLKENGRHDLEEELLLNLLPQSVLQQQDLDEFISDMSDIGGEDNLIEIDISIGSIRHSVTGGEIAT
ncbi:hypothetical protein C2S51_009930 [Perilla frutescens var. frutescens]|nr:hypothetical protein C2S51_009930 [Perilla frutescens var. frutescens]